MLSIAVAVRALAAEPIDDFRSLLAGRTRDACWDDLKSPTLLEPIGKAMQAELARGGSISTERLQATLAPFAALVQSLPEGGLIHSELRLRLLSGMTPSFVVIQWGPLATLLAYRSDHQLY